MPGCGMASPTWSRTVAAICSEKGTRWRACSRIWIAASKRMLSRRPAPPPGTRWALHLLVAPNIYCLFLLGLYVHSKHKQCL